MGNNIRDALLKHSAHGDIVIPCCREGKEDGRLVGILAQAGTSRSVERISELGGD